MTGRNFDTDPSTPGAIRGGTADTDPVGTSAEARKPNTDPGLGPSGPPAARGPSPVRVPPVGRQDSVEMLLDGMSAPQPERQKLTPQSAGEAAASYHAEHPVHPARTSPDEEPKVIVERPPLAPTVRVQREKLQAMIEQADAARKAKEAEEAELAGVPVSMGPRVLIAAVAGLVVVLLIFVVAKNKIAGTDSGTAGGAGTTATATATVTATTAAAATGTATGTATVAATATATSTAIPVADTTAQPAAPPPPTAHVPVTALPAAPATAPAATAKPKPRPTATSGDLGEFKSTFH
jgi:hypothetical protein